MKEVNYRLQKLKQSLGVIQQQEGNLPIGSIERIMRINGEEWNPDKEKYSEFFNRKCLEAQVVTHQETMSFPQLEELVKLSETKINKNWERCEIQTSRNYIKITAELVEDTLDENWKTAIAQGRPKIPKGTKVTILGVFTNFYGNMVKVDYLGWDYSIYIDRLCNFEIKQSKILKEKSYVNWEPDEND